MFETLAYCINLIDAMSKAKHMVETDRVVERWNMAFYGLISRILRVR